MNKYPREQILGLDESIIKWVNIVYGTGEDKGATNCPLCILNKETAGYSCNGCIIKEETGESVCRGIRYSQFVYHVHKEHIDVMGVTLKGIRIYCKDCKRLALNVLEDLEKIRANVCTDDIFFKITGIKDPIKGPIQIDAVTEKGEWIYHIASINDQGIYLHSGMRKDILRLPVDKNGRLVILNDS